MNNKRENYCKPCLHSIEMFTAKNTCEFISGSIGDGKADPGKGSLSNGRRGRWGDLWNEDKPAKITEEKTEE